MRRKFILPAVAAVLAVGALTAGTNASAQSATQHRVNDCAARNSRGRDLQVVGLVADGSLVCFQDDRPSRVDPIGQVTGLVQDTSLVGIDYRPANNLLYGVGNAGGVYTIDADTAAATLVSRINQPLQGTSFGVDFNPAVDRLRTISDAGQNLRTNVADGSTNVDGTLNIPGTPPVSPALGVTAAAYTNNDADPNTVTTLFDIDTTNDNVAVQAPANAGSLSPTGKLGVDAAGPVGFDIYSDVRDGTTVGLRALASITAADGSSSLYGVDLLTGRASAVGSFRVPVIDIAVPTAQS
jgi:hypothetical protein